MSRKSPRRDAVIEAIEAARGGATSPPASDSSPLVNASLPGLEPVPSGSSKGTEDNSGQIAAAASGRTGRAALKGRGGRAAATTARLSETVAAAADLLEEGDRRHAGIPDDARDLLLTEIEPDPMQPRRYFDETELKALADDIARRGVLQPILVRPPLTPGGPYRLVAGERRWRAAQMAGKVRIPARVREMGDEDVRGAQLVENVLRQGLTDIEKGRALRHLYELRKAQNYRTTWEDIASEVGLGRARIHDLFHLASLPEPVAQLIHAGRLSGSHGIVLQRAQGALFEDQIIALAEAAARPTGPAPNRKAGSYRMSVQELRAAIQDAIQNAPLTPGNVVETVTGAGTTDSASNGRVSPSRDGRTLSNGVPMPSRVRERADSPLSGGGRRSARAEVQPFVKRTVEALKLGALSAEEVAQLRAALDRVATPVGSPGGGES